MSNAAADRWLQRLGPVIEEDEVIGLLGVSRQELRSLAQAGAALAFAVSGTNHYPAWQFVSETQPPSIRPITPRIIAAFRDALADIPPYTIASWATTPQPEVNDQTPADWLRAGGDEAPVELAAQRAAHLEAM